MLTPLQEGVELSGESVRKRKIRSENDYRQKNVRPIVNNGSKDYFCKSK